MVIASIAAILPGGDPFSMLLLMVPQIALYGLGIALATRFGGPPLWAREPGRRPTTRTAEPRLPSGPGLSRAGGAR